MAERRGLGRLPGGGTRWRITLAVASLSLLAFTAFSLLAYLAVERSQRDRLNDQAVQELGFHMAQSATCAFDGPDFANLPYEISAAGRVLVSSPLLAPHEVSGPVMPESASPLTLQAGEPGSMSFFRTELTFPTSGQPNDLNGQRVPIVYADLAAPDSAACAERLPAGAKTMRVLVVQVDYQVRDVLRPIGQLLMWAIPVATVIAAAAAWWSAGRALGPVDQIRRRLSDVVTARAAPRVREPGTGDELDDLAAAVNAALDRLEGSDARQRTFIADAAHELRSPVATIRSTLEVARLYPDAESGQEAMESVDRQSARLAILVDSLLLLEALEAPPTGEPGSTDLGSLVEAAIEGVQPTRVPVTLTVASGLAAVRGDGNELARAVTNLLDNALRHASTRVDVVASVEQDMIRLEVRNDGEPIAEADRERIFDRLVRLDASRSSATGGAGIGLAIVRRAAERAGGSVEATETAGMTTFVLRLPVAPPPT